MMEFLLEAALKSVPIAALAFAALWVMKRKSASARFTLLAAIFATLAILPLAVFVSPKIAVIESPVAVPAQISTTMLSTEMVAVAGQDTTSFSLEATTPALTVEQGLLVLWLLGVLACWTSLARDILTGLKNLPSPTRRGASIAWAKEDSFGPFVWGWLKPQVVLPRALRNWDHSLRSALIAHEMAHVQRGDWPLRIAFRLIRGLYWFNPLVWLLEKRAAIESELACDDLVVTAGTDPARYAEGLLEVAKMQRLTTAPGAGSPRLKTRLLALFDNTRDRSQAGRGIKMAALAVAIAGVGTIAPLSVGSEAPVEKTTIPSALREAAQSSVKQMPAKATGQSSANSKGEINKGSTSKPAQGTGSSSATQGQHPSSVNRAGGVNVAGAQGQAPVSVNQAQGGSGTNKTGQGSASVNGSAPASQGGGGGGTASVNRAGGQSPAGVAQGGGGGFGSGQGSLNRAGGGSGQTSVGGSGGTLNRAGGQSPAGVAQGGAGGFGSGQGSLSRAGGGSGRASAGGSGGTLNQAGGGATGGFGQGDSVSTGGRGASGSIRPGADGNSVSATTRSDDPIGTKIVDMGDGIFRVTHVTEMGKFTAQGRNIELYKNGVLTLNAKLATNQQAVRHVAGYVTSAMSGRGSIAFVRPDAP